MRVGLLADIHGNANALGAVLGSARSAGVRHLVVAGDLVGYYYEVDRVLDLLSEWNWVAVRGNHEDMLAAWLAGRDQDWIAAKYGHGIYRAVDTLSDDRLEMLTNLPHPLALEISAKRVLVCHGSPWDVDEYVYPDATHDRRKRFRELKADIVVLGHTHYPMLWHMGPGGPMVVNPGSVGQPRDRKPGACWVMWDTETGTMTQRREAYDPATVLAQAARLDPELFYLRDVLTRTD